MSQLPEVTLTVTGLDYAGPLNINFSQEALMCTKAYICLFVYIYFNM